MNDYLRDAKWNPVKGQYEIGDDWRIKIWKCKERMRCERDACRIEDVDLDAVCGIAVQIVGGGRQTKRSIPAKKLEWLGGDVRETVNCLIDERMY